LNSVVIATLLLLGLLLLLLRLLLLLGRDKKMGVVEKVRAHG